MRQFVTDCLPDNRGLIELGDKDFKYIRQVLRLKPGDMIKVAFKNGQTADTTLAKVDDRQKKIILQVCQTQGNVSDNDSCAGESKQAGCQFVLLQFIPKPQKMELIIRQAVEAGVWQVIPVIGEYTQKGSEKSLCAKTGSGSSGRVERIDRIIKEARQQSGSPINTKVTQPMLLPAALDYIKELCSEKSAEDKSVLRLALYEKTDGSATMHQAIAKCGQEKIALGIMAVGCEGGISPDELEKLKAADFIPLHFDINILRCETASLYGMACMQNAVMECEQWQLKE